MANTTYQVPDEGLKRMLLLAFEHELPKVLAEYKAELEAGHVTPAMKRFFADLGWLSSDRDSRLGEPVDASTGTRPVQTEADLREPSETPRRGRQAKAPPADVAEEPMPAAGEEGS